MDTKDFLRLGVPLGEATRRAKDFAFILGGGAFEERGIYSASTCEDVKRCGLSYSICIHQHPSGISDRI